MCLHQRFLQWQHLCRPRTEALESFQYSMARAPPFRVHRLIKSMVGENARGVGRFTAIDRENHAKPAFCLGIEDSSRKMISWPKPRFLWRATRGATEPRADQFRRFDGTCCHLLFRGARHKADTLDRMWREEKMAVFPETAGDDGSIAGASSSGTPI